MKPAINTTPEMATPPAIGGIAKMKAFFSRNKQAIVNFLGVYFVFSYAIHNYRVKDAWDKREVEFRSLEAELNRIRSALTSEEWVVETSGIVNPAQSKNHSSKEASAAALTAQVQKVLQYTPPTAEERVAMALAQKKGESMVSSAAGYIFSGAGRVGVGGNSTTTDSSTASASVGDAPKK